LCGVNVVVRKGLIERTGSSI